MFHNNQRWYYDAFRTNTYHRHHHDNQHTTSHHAKTCLASFHKETISTGDINHFCENYDDFLYDLMMIFLVGDSITFEKEWLYHDYHVPADVNGILMIGVCTEHSAPELQHNLHVFWIDTTTTYATATDEMMWREDPKLSFNIKIHEFR